MAKLFLLSLMIMILLDIAYQFRDHVGLGPLAQVLCVNMYQELEYNCYYYKFTNTVLLILY